MIVHLARFLLLSSADNMTEAGAMMATNLLVPRESAIMMSRSRSMPR